MADSPLKNIHPSIREVAVLQESTEMILSSMDVDTVLHQILLIVRNYFGAANCAIFLVDAGGQELYCRAQNGFSESVMRNRRLRIGHDGLAGWVAQHKTPLYAGDVSREPRYVMFDERVRSELALPLIVRDEVLGVLSIGSEEPDHFNDSMIGLLALFAGQAAVAVENARLYSSERRRMRQIELINLIARSATAANDVEQLLHNLADLIDDTFDASDVCILLRDREGKLATRAYAGINQNLPESFAESERVGIIGQAFSTRMNAVANDVAARQNWPACFPGAGSELCVPLVSFGETLGALIVSHPSAQFFNMEDRSIAQAAADVCATAIRNVQLAEELRRITNIDALTSLYNQRYFHVLAAQETARSRRYRKHFSLLMLELEAVRHPGGAQDFEGNDELLKQVAQALKRQMRSVDAICRYGADRFVIILPETAQQRLGIVTEKLGSALAEISVPAGALRLAPAFATATYPEDGSNELELVRALLARIAEAGGNSSSASA